jgi:hypothetical protein
VNSLRRSGAVGTWCNRLRSERGVDKLANAPSPIHNAQRLRWRHLEGFVSATQIVMRDVQREPMTNERGRQMRQPLLKLSGRPVV